MPFRRSVFYLCYEKLLVLCPLSLSVSLVLVYAVSSVSFVPLCFTCAMRRSWFRLCVLVAGEAIGP